MLSVNLNTNPPWSSGAPLKILKILGGSDKTMVVGGAVRDWLCDEPVEDIDFATKLLPEEAMKILLDSGFNVKPTGIEHGTITVYYDNKSYEITSLRKDIHTDGRHAKVIYGGTWEEDAYRRDFTINALYSDEFGSILDFTGNGFKDLENKKLRFIGDPSKRLEEDYLRLLRYFRFLSRFLDNIDNDSMNACVKLAKKLNLLSAERLLLEFNKILTSKNSVIILNKIIKNDVLTNIFEPVSINNYQLNKNLLKNVSIKLSKYKNRINYPFIIYVSFLISFLPQKETDKNKIISIVTQKFKLSKNDKRLLKRNVNWLLNIKNINKTTIINLWIDNEELDVMDLKDILLINNINIKKDLKSAFDKAPPKFPISGNDLIKKGVKEGEEVGQLLDKIKDWWISKDCKPSYTECLNSIKKFHS
ncbi:MAG: CCA-adding enzyme [Alphaproteobacteria bacterium MarineAlpha9_Bin3]|nr:MAG: CCA-adding enzyme [Alphaproteobacteria bacterium MarineAlpha9_Bin3]|tara:strand:- start:3993 stop:5246 length:1254 start_codon:yes stop_codon:yes gene_type:complete